MNLTYEVFENGYYILLNGQRWIGQGGEFGDYFPFVVRSDSGEYDYKEMAKAHIEEIIIVQEKAVQEATKEQERLENIESSLEYLVMMSE